MIVFCKPKRKLIESGYLGGKLVCFEEKCRFQEVCVYHIDNTSKKRNKKVFNMAKFPKIRYGKLETKGINGIYHRDTNEIAIDVSPCSFGVEYEFYGFRGLTRDLTATVIHELCHWATSNLNGHNDKRTLGNSFRTRRLLQCDSWTLKIHSVLYDLQKTDSHRVYFDSSEDSEEEFGKGKV